jgi:hypothetical protein
MAKVIFEKSLHGFFLALRRSSHWKTSAAPTAAKRKFIALNE